MALQQNFLYSLFSECPALPKGVTAGGLQTGVKQFFVYTAHLLVLQPVPISDGHHKKGIVKHSRSCTVLFHFVSVVMTTRYVTGFTEIVLTVNSSLPIKDRKEKLQTQFFPAQRKQFPTQFSFHSSTAVSPLVPP